MQQEFFEQGDREREAGMPVSALMDRNKASKLSSSQVQCHRLQGSLNLLMCRLILDGLICI